MKKARGTVLATAIVCYIFMPGCGTPTPSLPPDAPDAPSLSSSGTMPSIILISLDTVRPDHLGCYGYDRNTSPNLDRFAKECVLFRNAYAQAPWTLPSHMSLFTSMLPSHCRVEDLGQKLSKDIPTLAQILKVKGYNTAALVNNGQMRAHWGFDRGFDLWREFQVDTPEGNCENVTSEAMKWLASAPKEPYFLFLHYYDPHDPYAPPEKYRDAFGSSLTGEQARSIVWDARSPEREIDNPDLMRQVIASYDGEIAWLDNELGKLFKAIPDDTLVVIFSDHGEAFEEHGWTTHGAALYEEEVRVALMIRPRRVARTAISREAPAMKMSVEDPVMLLDVAPTILSLCGIEPPAHYEGMDLTPLMEGRKPPERIILSETKRVLEGRALKMCMRDNWKLIYSVFDGATELYRLPDEQTDLSKKEPGQLAELLDPAGEWMAEEDFRMVHMRGTGGFSGKLTVADGRVSVFIPVGFDHDRDWISPSRNGTEILWRVYPGGRVKSLCFEVSPRDAHVEFDLQRDDREQKNAVFFRREPADPFIRKPFIPDTDGFHIVRYRGARAGGRSAEGVTLDEETVRHLRSLGYLE